MSLIENLKFPMDVEMIKTFLPHREPFLFLDEVTKISLNYDKPSIIVAKKKLHYDSDFFRGHFPGNPVMPGVLMIEAAAQAGVILGKMVINNINGLFLFTEVKNAKFRKIVKPGDCLDIRVELIKMRDPLFISNCEIFVNEELSLRVTIQAFRQI